MKTDKQLEPVLIRHDHVVEAIWTRQAEKLTGELQAVVGIWANLEFGPLHPDQFIELIQSPEAVFARAKEHYIQVLHKEEQRKAGRPLDINHTAASVGIFPTDLFLAIENIGVNRAIAINIPDLYKLEKGKVQMNTEVAARHKEITFKKILTDPSLIEEYYLSIQAADILTRLSKISQKNNPDQRPLIYFDTAVVEFRWMTYFNINVHERTMNADIRRFVSTI